MSELAKRVSGEMPARKRSRLLTFGGRRFMKPIFFNVALFTYHHSACAFHPQAEVSDPFVSEAPS